MFAIMVHKNFNLKRRLVTFFWGETMDFDRFSTLHSTELVEAVFSMSSHIQKLELCKTEMIILSCIPLFFTGKYPGICPFLLIKLHCIIECRKGKQPLAERGSLLK